MKYTDGNKALISLWDKFNQGESQSFMISISIPEPHVLERLGEYLK